MFKRILRPGLPLFKKAVDFLEEKQEIFYSKSYSQEGEDMILRDIFINKPRGVFVDVGAHHPLRFSNTYYFYEQGWQGINIDATPGSMDLFNKMRPNDINLEIGISLSEKDLTFTLFDEPALNTFDEEIVKDRLANTSYKIIGKKNVKTLKLSSVLQEHLGEKNIDFLTIDVEGFDLQVLQSNDWEKYRPTVILVEILQSIELEASDVHVYLSTLGYKNIAKTTRTYLYSI